MRPAQSSNRVTFSRRSSAVGSSITRRRLPSASSRTVENERWLRSRLFGVNTTSGLIFSTSA
jgi:hypothetical protein